MQPFTAELTHFLETAIESVEQVEILRILAADSENEWSTNDLARAVQTSSRNVLQHVIALEGEGLLRVRRDSGVFCRYMPATAKSEELVSALLQCYNERPVTMIRMLAERTSRTPE